jgi:hypothetical protein
MTVYKKLTEARLKLLSADMKKSGKNKFAGYEYFELGDFIPHIHQIFNEVGLCGVFSFEGSNVTLTIHDVDGTGSVAFVSPVVSASNPKGQAIQDLGSTHTYLRRYLWLMAMEITEHDSVDAVVVEKPTEREKPVTKAEKPVEKQAEKAVENKPENANHALFVDKTIEWANLITKRAELADVWKTNQEDINNLKKESPELYEKLKARFSELKANLKE